MKKIFLRGDGLEVVKRCVTQENTDSSGETDEVLLLFA